MDPKDAYETGAKLFKARCHKCHSLKCWEGRRPSYPDAPNLSGKLPLETNRWGLRTILTPQWRSKTDLFRFCSKFERDIADQGHHTTQPFNWKDDETLSKYLQQIKPVFKGVSRPGVECKFPKLGEDSKESREALIKYLREKPHKGPGYKDVYRYKNKKEPDPKEYAKLKREKGKSWFSWGK